MNRKQNQIFGFHSPPGNGGDKGNSDSGVNQLTHNLRTIAFQNHSWFKSGNLTIGICDLAEAFSFVEADKLLV